MTGTVILLLLLVCLLIALVSGYIYLTNTTWRDFLRDL